MSPPSVVDVLVITALRDELEALLDLAPGGRTDWTEDKDIYGFPYHYRVFQPPGTPDKNPAGFCLAAAWSGQMGDAVAAARAASLVQYLKPRCLATCGICAGDRERTFLGDVIVAERAYNYAYGKIISSSEPGGHKEETHLHDIKTYNLPEIWKIRAENLANDTGWKSQPASERPLSIQWQRRWLLRTLLQASVGKDLPPLEHSQRQTTCPAWSDVLKSALKLRLIEVSDGSLLLTPLGRQEAQNDLLFHPDGIEDQPKFSVHTASMATGPAVRQDPNLFVNLRKHLRNTWGVEMESSAIGYVAESSNIPCIIVKAVSDHGDDDKDDLFRAFACKMSAKFLLDFFSRHYPHDLLPDGEGGRFRQNDPWGAVKRLSQHWQQDIKDCIGTDIKFERHSEASSLESALKKQRLVVLVGESGVGKSALAKEFSLKNTIQGDMYGLHIHDLVSYEKGIISNAPEKSLTDLIAAYSKKEGLLIIDGLEWLHGTDSWQLVARVIRALKLNEPSSPWRLLLVCQTPGWSTVRRVLYDSNAFSVREEVVSIGGFSDAEIVQLRELAPSLIKLLQRRELWQVIGRPRIIDLLMREGAASLGEVDQWLGESQLIEWYWKHYACLGPNSTQVAIFLQELARDQADRYSYITPLTELPANAPSEAADSLLSRGVLIERDGCLRFTHDLDGDYARQRYLISKLAVGDVNAILQREANTRWQRALRLTSLYYLESNKLETWERLVREFWSKKCKITVDLFLEAIVYSSQPQLILDALRNRKRLLRGALLRRLIKRFLVSTTVPHKALLEHVSESADPSIKNYLETQTRYRLPVVYLWEPFLGWMIANHKVVLKDAANEWLDCIDIWLWANFYIARTMQNFRFLYIDDLAEMINDLARRALRHSLLVKDKEKVFTLLLLSRLSSRLNAQIDKRIVTTIKLLAGMKKLPEPKPSPPRPIPPELMPLTRSIFGDEGELVGPWPLGPVARPHQEFQNTALSHTGAWLLLQKDRGFGQRVFRALIIEHPYKRYQYSSHMHRDRQYGFDDNHKAYPPFHDFPPFALLMEQSPSEGIDFILELVDFGTERWAVQQRELRAIELEIDGAKRTYVGDDEVFHWCRGIRSEPSVLISALMTLEKWLYDQDDQKKLSDSIVKNILVKSESLAIVGVMFYLGMRSPSLFFGVLEPLVGSLNLYWLGGRHSYQRMEAAAALIPWSGWSRTPQSRIDLARQWHSSKHRHINFQDAVIYCFTRRGCDWPALERARDIWRQHVDHNKSNAIWIESLIGVFDKSNWKRVTDPDKEGQIVLQFTPPAELTARSEAATAPLESEMEQRWLPARCSIILEGKQPCSETEFLRLVALADKDGPLSEDEIFFAGGRWGVQCAVVAVAQRCFPQWLDAHADWKAKGRSWLLQACQELAHASDFVPDPTVGDWVWDRFCAEALVWYWDRSPDDPDLRLALGTLVAAPHPAGRESLFAALAKVRQHHIEDFSRLLHLAVWCARLYLFGGFVKYECPPNVPGPSVRPIFQELVDLFVSKKLTTLPQTWDLIAEAIPTQVRDFPAIERLSHGFDMDILWMCLKWLPDYASTQVQDERKLLIEWLIGLTRTLFTYCTNEFSNTEEDEEDAPQTIASRPKRRRSCHVRPETKVPLENCYAKYIAYANNREERAELLTPWSNAPIEFSDWIGEMIGFVYTYWLDRDIDDHQFYEVLNQFFEVALAQGSWLDSSSTGRASADVARPLLGAGQHFALHEAWKEERAGVAVRLKERWHQWLKSAYRLRGCVNSFCVLMRAPAFKRIYLESIIWLSEILPNPWPGTEESIEELAELLSYVYTETGALTSIDQEQRKAVERLLALLVALQNTQAMLLTKRIANA